MTHRIPLITYLVVDYKPQHKKNLFDANKLDFNNPIDIQKAVAAMMIWKNAIVEKERLLERLRNATGKELQKIANRIIEIKRVDRLCGGIRDGLYAAAFESPGQAVLIATALLEKNQSEEYGHVLGVISHNERIILGICEYKDSRNLLKDMVVRMIEKFDNANAINTIGILKRLNKFEDIFEIASRIIRHKYQYHPLSERIRICVISEAIESLGKLEKPDLAAALKKNSSEAGISLL